MRILYIVEQLWRANARSTPMQATVARVERFTLQGEILQQD